MGAFSSLLVCSRTVHVSVPCRCVCLMIAIESPAAVQGASKNEEWAGWESAAAKEGKASHTTDEWGKW